MGKEELEKQKNEKERDLKTHHTQLNTIEEKINDAKNIVKKFQDLKEDMEDLKKDVRKLKNEDHDHWKGDLLDKWQDDTDEHLVDGSFKTYIKNIDQNVDDLNEKIMKLENEKLEEQGIIGEIKSGINWLSTEITNIVN